MSAWTHAICRDCWLSQHPDEPAHALTNHVSSETCCFCLAPTADGIYVRQDPRTVACGGGGGPHGEESGWQPAKAQVEPGVIEHGLNERPPSAWRNPERLRALDWQARVAEFNRGAGQTVASCPQLPSGQNERLFLGAPRDPITEEEVDALLWPTGRSEQAVYVGGLLEEELDEIRAAASASDLPSVADGIADLIYVALGLANACGVRLAPIFDAVHAANMEKFSGPKSPAGKILKPVGWRPPDVAELLRKQGWVE